MEEVRLVFKGKEYFIMGMLLTAESAEILRRGRREESFRNLLSVLSASRR
jgi:hypothetical protein